MSPTPTPQASATCPMSCRIGDTIAPAPRGLEIRIGEALARLRVKKTDEKGST